MVELGSFLRRAGICNAEIQEGPVFTIKQEDIDKVGLEGNTQVEVIIVRVNPNEEEENLIKSTSDLLSSNRFSSMFMGATNQIPIPNEVDNSLDLSVGDKISYVVFPKDNVPSLKSGPVRNQVSGTNDKTDPVDIDPSDREEMEAEYQGVKMRQTGQIKVPGEVRDRLAIVPGKPPLRVEVSHEGESGVFTTTLNQTGNRITIPKDVRLQTGLQKDPDARKSNVDARPSVQISVMEG